MNKVKALSGKLGEKSDQALSQSQASRKNILPNLTRAFDHWLNIPEDKLDQIENITQKVDKTCLLVDDMQDESVLKGLEATNTQYKVSALATSATYSLMSALGKCFFLDHPDALKVTVDLLLEMVEGQGVELYMRNNVKCPTEEEYRDMAIKKTGAFFKLTCQLMQLFSTNKEDYSDLADNIGLLFQIVDDYKHLNCKNESDIENCTALTEGKFGFPIVHAIQNNPEELQLISILRQRTEDFDRKQYCVTLLEKYGSFYYTRRTIKKLKSEVDEKIKKLGGNKLLLEIVDSFCSNIF